MNLTLIEESIKHILSHKITQEELDIFTSSFTVKKIPKNGYVFKQGDFPKYVTFINTGVLKFYYLQEGKEQIKKIYLHSEWAADYGAFLRRQPYQSNLKALTDSEVLLLSYEDMQNGMDNYKVFERFGRLIAEHVYLELEDVIRQMVSKTPEERYKLYVENNPEIINKVPLKYIASILGILPESLSRIRKRAARN